MKKTIIIISILVAVSFQFSCSDNNDEQVSAFCDKLVLIDNDVFQNRSDDDGTSRNAFEIINAEIEGDCLSITIRSGGCDGSTWTLDLVDADRVAETAIPQRDLKVFLENTETCNAIAELTVSFEINSLRTNENQITLNLEKWDSQLTYSY